MQTYKPFSILPAGRFQDIPVTARAEFAMASDRLTLWCKTALMYWDHQARDPKGGFAEHLDMTGRADFNHMRRVRVQFRQAYVYAHAAELGWYVGAKSAADHAWSFGIGPGCAGGKFIRGRAKGCAHLVKGSGEMMDDGRDTYAQAFLLLAAAWRYRAFGDKSALRKAKATLGFLNRHLKADNGGWHEALPQPKQQTRRQNPHMHLFEAMLALFESTRDEDFLDQAHDIFALFENHFFDPRRLVLLEFFNADWTPKGDGGPVEPGHMMEWSWLLREYTRLSGRDTRYYSEALYQSALDYGLNRKLGLLRDAVNVDRTPHHSTLRTWPQTEFIKASVASAMKHDDEKSYRIATETINGLFSYYLNVPEPGGWADKLSPHGDVISTIMPTSTFYHLFCAAVEADKLRQKIKL